MLKIFNHYNSFTGVGDLIPYLVGGFNHLEKYERQWEGFSHISWKIKAMFQTINQQLNPVKQPFW
jgi:hypothetical protein